MLAHSNYFANTVDERVYNVAIYLRLSKEDETVGQSESIKNQKDFLVPYVIEKGWNLYDIYIDDGYTGTNFNRPDFKRMITDIESMKVNLVITKDLSRLGRDYIDTGNYIERYFPMHSVRYIAVNDGIDTFTSSSSNDMSPFKSVMNDMYAKDTSIKVRSIFYNKRKNGEFIGGFAPYGYEKDPNNKGRLIIDNTAAAIVRRIFNDYVNGESMCSITRALNQEDIMCPAKYKGTNSTYKNAMIKRYIWTQETVKRILTNPTYMGDMTQHRQEKINYKVDKYKKIPPEHWIIKEDTHEPIVPRETFNLVQELIKKKIVHYDRVETAYHLLNGLVFCKDCGSKMTYRRNRGKMKLLCMVYSKYGKASCSSHTIDEDYVEKYVIADLKRISNHVLSDEFYTQFKAPPTEQEDDTILPQIGICEKRLNEIKTIIKSLYEDRVKSIISEDMFIQMSSEYNEEKDTLNKKIVALKKQMEGDKQDDSMDYMDILKSLAQFDVPDRVLLCQLIKKIEISEAKEIEIFYSFPNPYASVVAGGQG